MTVRYDANAVHLGMSVTRYRDALRSWDRTYDLRRLAEGSLFDEDIATAAVVVDDAEARGLFGFDDSSWLRDYGPTEAGRGLLAATPMRPIPAAKGWGLVEGVIANAERAAKDPDMPFSVSRIWCYGSLAQGSPTVNDVDLVVEIEIAKDLYRDGSAAAKAKVRDMARAMGGDSFLRRQLGDSAIPAARYVARKVLYGARMNPRISPGDLESLIGLHRPCRLMYDSSLGGRVTRPTLPHHPASTGRHAQFEAPRRMPDLSSGPVLPVRIAHGVDVANAFSDFDEISRRIEPFGALALHPDGYGQSISQRPPSPALARWLDAGGPLDGRTSGVIVFERRGENPPGWRDPIDAVLAVRLDRRFDTAKDGSIRYRVGDPEFLDPAARIAGSPVALAVAIAGCLVADMTALSLRTGLPASGIAFSLDHPGRDIPPAELKTAVLGYADIIRTQTARRVAMAIEYRTRKRDASAYWAEDDETHAASAPRAG